VGIKNKSFKLLITRVPEGCQSISLDLTLHEHFNDAVAIKRAAVQNYSKAKAEKCVPTSVLLVKVWRK